MDLPFLLRCGTLHDIFPLDFDSSVNNLATSRNNGKIKDNNQRQHRHDTERALFFYASFAYISGRGEASRDAVE